MESTQRRTHNRHRLAPMRFQEAASDPALTGIDELVRSFVAPACPHDSTKVMDRDSERVGSSGASEPLPSSTPEVVTTPEVASTSEVESPAAVDERSQEPAVHELRKCTLAQYCHTGGDDKVYQALYFGAQVVEAKPWNHNKKMFSIKLIKEDSETKIRTVKASAGALAAVTGMTKRNCRHAIERLIHKLSIDRVTHGNSANREEATFLVFPWSKIIERRKAAGLTHVKGKKLVNEQGVDPRPRDEQNERVLAHEEADRARRRKKQRQSQQDAENETTPEVDSTPEVISTPPSSVEATPVPDVESTPVLESSSLGNINSKTTTNDDVRFDRELVFQAVESYVLPDESAVDQIIAKCRKKLPDCSAQEIAEAVHEKGRTINTKTHSRLAYLIKFAPETIIRIRGRRERAVSIDHEQQLQAKRERILHALSRLPRENVWSKILVCLRDRTDRHSFEIWVQPCQFVKTEDSVLIVGVPTIDHPEVIKLKFESQIIQANEELRLGITEFRFIPLDQLTEDQIGD